MIETPRAFMSRISRNRFSVSWSLSALVGSSSTRILTSLVNARAISTSCFSATDSASTGVSGSRCSRPNCFITARASR